MKILPLLPLLFLLACTQPELPQERPGCEAQEWGTLKFQNTSLGEVAVKVDGQAWDTVAEKSTRTKEGLTVGIHRIEAVQGSIALDKYIQIDGPCEVETVRF